MKAPQIAAIPDATPETSFSERTKIAKKTAAAAVKRSFSLGPDDATYIDKMALKLGQKRGKSMTASEALRSIISDHRARP